MNAGADDPDSLGAVVRSLRLGKQWTQYELAARVGVTSQTISNIERGESARVHDDTIEGLAKALDVTPEELDARRLGSTVAKRAISLSKRRAIERVLSLSDEAVNAILEGLAKKGKRQ